MKTKIFSISLIIILIMNLIFMALGKITVLFFWIISILVAIIAYKILPNIKT